MNPIAPISMLAGKGSGTAIAVIAVLIGLVIVAKQQGTLPKTNSY